MALQAGSEQGGFTRVTETLLDEVSNIIEWPVPVYCRFEESFLEVPEEALIASMEDHQKFFPVLDADGGTLTSGFVVIANLESTHVDAVREGFERVIRPRLADAQFFWEQDRKKPLADYSSALDDVVFQKKLGSIGDKSKRIAKISSKLAELTNKDQTHAARASGLCKADLLTQMVGEFPELQGTMGGHYARVSGEDKAVSNAIAEHYAPRFAGDAIPASAIGQLVSLADRMDSLVGIFAAGLKPTGNKDPFALRRAALGAVRILTEADIQVSLDELLNISAKALGSSIEVTQQNIAEVRTFMLERLRHDCLDHGFETNVVNAVFAAPVSTLPDLRSRLEALNAFMDQPVAERLIAANKRIGNILRKADFDISTKIDTNLLNIAEEKQLFDEVNRLKAELDPVFSRAEYAPALAALAGLDETIAAFFDHVMVMDEDSAVRDNRLALLNQLKSMFDRIADLAQAT
jgi:glycyl-tRNA synthetase beta chain